MINIPTPETDNCARVYEAAGMPAAHRALVKERDQLRKELSNKTGYAHLVSEIDQLRKVVDELANIIYFHSLRPQNALDGYNQLPHIQERETK